MRRLVHRLPGSRALTPTAQVSLLTVLGGAVVALGIVSGAWTVGDDTRAMPLVALDVQEGPAQPPREAKPSWPVPAAGGLSVEPVRETARPVEPVEAVAEPAVSEAPQTAKPRAPMFDGRPLRKARTITMRVTAYSPDERSCGKWADGKTASGYSVWTNGMKLVAADTRVLPFHSIISVPGYHSGKPVPVLDRGGVIKGNRLDVLFPTHEIAKQWGVQELEVTVWEYAD